MKRDNIEIMVRISVKDNTHYPIKEATTIVDAEERIVLSATNDEITDRLIVMVERVSGRAISEMARIEAAEVADKPVDMVAIAKSAAGIK